MSSSELNERNFMRICFINWALSFPLLLLFSWPYFLLCELYAIPRMVAIPGSLIFALPFMLTILHGHVTLAVGALHRKEYYNWLQGFPLTYGLLFHPIIIRTRFRLVLFALSLFILAVGFLLL
ncbi:MAG: hypothetical protein ACNA78_11250 [Balneolaceae bacterium]